MLRAPEIYALLSRLTRQDEALAVFRRKRVNDESPRVHAYDVASLQAYWRHSL